jgi:hypothetical protein
MIFRVAFFWMQNLKAAPRSLAKRAGLLFAYKLVQFAPFLLETSPLYSACECAGLTFLLAIQRKRRKMKDGYQ